jgi:hypothetical protein
MNTRDVAGLRAPHLNRVLDALKDQNRRSSLEWVRQMESLRFHAQRVDDRLKLA